MIRLGIFDFVLSSLFFLKIARIALFFSFQQKMKQNIPLGWSNFSTTYASFWLLLSWNLMTMLIGHPESKELWSDHTCEGSYVHNSDETAVFGIKKWYQNGARICRIEQVNRWQLTFTVSNFDKNKNRNQFLTIFGMSPSLKQLETRFSVLKVKKADMIFRRRANKKPDKQ